MRAARVLFLAFCAIFPGSVALADEPEKAPFIGRDGPEMDACGGIASVFGRDSRGREALPVREHPDEYARKKDDLPPRTLVWLCDADGEWQGIVYPSGEFQELQDCRVSSPIAEPRAYAGPCKSGWVLANRLQLVAG